MISPGLSFCHFANFFFFLTRLARESRKGLLLTRAKQRETRASVLYRHTYVSVVPRETDVAERHTTYPPPSLPPLPPSQRESGEAIVPIGFGLVFLFDLFFVSRNNRAPRWWRRRRRRRCAARCRVGPQRRYTHPTEEEEDKSIIIIIIIIVSFYHSNNSYNNKNLDPLIIRRRRRRRRGCLPTFS